MWRSITKNGQPHKQVGNWPIRFFTNDNPNIAIDNKTAKSSALIYLYL